MATTPNYGWPRPTLSDPADVEEIGQTLDAIDANLYRDRVVLDKDDQPTIANNSDVDLSGGWSPRPGHQYGSSFQYQGGGVIGVLRPMVALATVYTAWMGNNTGSRRTDFQLRPGVVIRHQAEPPASTIFGYTISHADSFDVGDELKVTVFQNSGAGLSLYVARWAVVPLVLL